MATTPSELRLHLRLNRACNMYDLTVRFNTEAEIIRDMLQIWINKGCLRCSQKTDNCGSKCSKCHPLMTEIYEWVE